MGMFQSEGFRLICINTHLDFEPTVQVESAHLILRYLSLFPSEVPAILVGDFNAEPESEVYHVFSGGVQEGRSGEENTFENALAPAYPGTYHGFTGVPDGRHIDWIMYRGNLDIISADVISNPIGGIFPSDHFPLQSDFRGGAATKREP